MSLNSTFQTTASATGQDFSRWQSHAKTLTASQIRFVINDCKKARQAMLTIDRSSRIFLHGESPLHEAGQPFSQVRADYYLDQLITYEDELIDRASR